MIATQSDQTSSCDQNIQNIKLCIFWSGRGQAGNGELGYGPDGKKSSANPDKVYALEGVHTHQVACGIGHTLFLVKPGAKQVRHLTGCRKKRQNYTF